MTEKANAPCEEIFPCWGRFCFVFFVKKFKFFFYSLYIDTVAFVIKHILNNRGVDMAILKINRYKKSKVPILYWERIADYLSCCDAKMHCLDSEQYACLRYGEDKVYFDSLLEELQIPKIFWESICNEIRCPECGRHIRADSVVSINYSYKELREYREILRFIKTETKSKLMKFNKFLKKNPTKGKEHEIGLKISNEIDDFCLSVIQDEIWYRARNFKLDEQKNLLKRDDMLPPPKEKAREGRYNRFGERVLYLGNKQFTCLAEICNGNLNKNCYIQRFRISSKRLLDFSRYSCVEEIESIPLFIAGALCSELILKHNYEKCEEHPEYAITHFISDLCKEKNIDGIIYPSAVMKFQDGNRGKNLVLFDWEKCALFEGESYFFSGKDNLLEVKMSNSKTGKTVEPVVQMISDI